MIGSHALSRGYGLPRWHVRIILTLLWAYAIVALIGCASCPSQKITAVICPQLKDHDGVSDIEADEEAENLPQGSAIYGEHVELKQIRETIESKCKAT